MRSLQKTKFDGDVEVPFSARGDDVFASNHGFFEEPVTTPITGLLFRVAAFQGGLGICTFRSPTGFN